MPKRTAETQITKNNPDQEADDQSSPLAARWWAWSPERRQDVILQLMNKISSAHATDLQRQQWQQELDEYRAMESKPPAVMKATAAVMASRK